MTKRSYTRRSDGEIIEDLQAQIEKLQKRISKKERPDGPVIKELPKIKRTLARFAQLCIDNDRGDMSNTVLAFGATLERQAQDVPMAKGVSVNE